MASTFIASRELRIPFIQLPPTNSNMRILGKTSKGPDALGEFSFAYFAKIFVISSVLQVRTVFFFSTKIWRANIAFTYHQLPFIKANRSIAFLSTHFDGDVSTGNFVSKKIVTVTTSGTR